MGFVAFAGEQRFMSVDTVIQGIYLMIYRGQGMVMSLQRPKI